MTVIIKHLGEQTTFSAFADKHNLPIEVGERTQDDFDITIGKLDRVLSKLVLWSHDSNLDVPNKQTLKHHAEDMVAAGNHILKHLEKINGTPQPEEYR